MNFWKRLIGSGREKPANPALAKVRLHFPSPTPRQSTVIERVPRLAATFSQGADYVSERVIIDLMREYDERFRSGILRQLSDERRQRITRQTLHYMMFHAYAQLSSRVDDPNLAGLLLDAVHFEIFGSLPQEQGSFVEFLRYENRNFEDPAYAPAFKFGQDLAGITEMADINLPMMLSQQSPLIAELTRQLVQLAVSEEAAPSPPSGAPP